MSVFEKCLIPLNGTAKSVTSKGEAFTPKINRTNETWDFPKPLKPPPLNTMNLTGTTRGSMKIIGYLGTRSKFRRHSWLAKCVCGKYERRDGKVWRRALKRDFSNDECSHCSSTSALIKKEYFKRTGKYKNN